MTTLPPTFAVDPLPDAAGFRLTGELDLATAPRLGAALRSAERNDGVVLDASELSFIDSSGWNELVGYLRECDSDTRVTILNASRIVVRSMELMGLGTHPAIRLASDDA